MKILEEYRCNQLRRRI